jgi:hypothetical protein
MTRRRAIRSILHNFLATYTSRYSDYDGYWIFGMIVGGLEEMDIDLLRFEDCAADAAPLPAAKNLAVTRFSEQIEKSRLAVSCVREARLTITKAPGTSSGLVNGCMRPGYEVRLTARAASDLGKTYESIISIFVAPHNPSVEQRSTRRISS